MSFRMLSLAVAIFGLIVQPALTGFGQTQPTAPAFEGEYFVTRSLDPICVPFARNLNQFRRLDFDVCDPRLSEKYPQFTRPTWEEVPFDLGLAETIFRILPLPPRARTLSASGRSGSSSRNRCARRTS